MRPINRFCAIQHSQPTDSIKSGSLARGQIFYEGMHTALRIRSREDKNWPHCGQPRISIILQIGRRSEDDVLDEDLLVV